MTERPAVCEKCGAISGDDWKQCGGVCPLPDSPHYHPAVDGACAAVAAIQFALSNPEGMTFLRLWNEGEFDTLRREWPEAPSEVYIGADPLAAQQPAAVDEKYAELIYAVARKYPGESRHETALRYIRQADVGRPRPRAGRHPTPGADDMRRIWRFIACALLVLCRPRPCANSATGWRCATCHKETQP